MLIWARSFIVQDAKFRNLDVPVQRSRGYRWTITVNDQMISQHAVPFRASDASIELDQFLGFTSVRRSQAHVFWRDEWECGSSLGGHSLDRSICIIFNISEYAQAIDGSDPMLLPLISARELPFFLLCTGRPSSIDFNELEIIPLVEESQFAKAQSFLKNLFCAITVYLEPATLMADSSLSPFEKMENIRLSLTKHDLTPDYELSFLLRSHTGAVEELTIEVASVLSRPAIRIVSPRFIPAWLEGDLVSDLMTATGGVAWPG